MIGRALEQRLLADGKEVVPVSRRPIPGGIQWDPASGRIDPEPWTGIDAVVHLAGESIAAGRWTDERKRLLRESRIGPTHLLSKMLAGLKPQPSALISASAIGYYGDRGDELLTESAPPGDDFLARLVVEWEAATRPASAAGIRVANLRFGVILSTDAGMLDRLLMPFKLGLGARLGTGTQWMSWVTLDDVIEVITRGLADERYAGPINVVAPEPVRNTEFTEQLGKALSRPAFLALPAPVLRVMFGELADVAMLASQRMEPARLNELGYRFHHQRLGEALVALLVA